MFVTDVLKTAALMLGLDADFAPLFAGRQADDSTQAEFEKLVKSFNLCYTEICTDYIPLLKKEQVDVKDGRIYFDELSESIKEVFALKTPGGRNVRYKLLLDFLEVNYAGGLNLTYSFMPYEFASEDSLDNFSGRVSEKCLALGTAAEFCFINSCFDDAQIWDSRFKQSLMIAVNKKSEISIPKRRWC